jgi:hypothetical protein
MRLFGSIKVTDRIRIGGSTGGRKKKSSKGGSGCGLIIVVLMIICVPIALIKSCFGGDEPKTVETTSPVSSIGVEELSFAIDEYELDVGDDRTGWVRVKGTENFTVDDFVFVSADESIATIEYDSTSLDTYLYFVIKGISPGTTTVYIKTADDAVVSKEITVTVLEAETTTEAETTKAATTKIEEQTQLVFTGRIVYKTPDGERYHFDKECAGKNARELHLDEAEYWGYRPCGTCVE